MVELSQHSYQFEHFFLFQNSLSWHKYKVWTLAIAQDKYCNKDGWEKKSYAECYSTQGH